MKLEFFCLPRFVPVNLFLRVDFTQLWFLSSYKKERTGFAHEPELI